MPLTEEQSKSLEGKGVEWRRIHYVEADQALDALGRGNASIVDTRKPEVYAEGHFPDAVHARERDALLGLSRSRSFYLYCT